MARLVVLPDEEFDRLRQLVGEETVFVSQSAAAEAARHGIDAEALKEEAEPYDFIGVPDAVVEFVDSAAHAFIASIIDADTYSR